MANENTADYGPLELLFGTWKGDKGTDVSPEPDDDETSPYYETIIFERGGDLDNAATQVLAIARYHLIVKRKSNDEIFHDQVGYWLWDKENKTIMHSFTIPRGMAVLTTGKLHDAQWNDKKATFEVKAGKDSGIVQTDFMLRNAKTLEFTQKLTVSQTELSYSQTTALDIYGRKMDHTDENTLTKV